MPDGQYALTPAQASLLLTLGAPPILKLGSNMYMSSGVFFAQEMNRAFG